MKKVIFICIIVVVIKDVKLCNVVPKDELIQLNKHSEVDNLSFCRLFLVGETHYKRTNDFIWFKMVKSLYHDYGVTEIILEESPAKAYLLNEFLHTSESELYYIPFDGDQYKRLYHRLKLYLKENNIQSITLHGVDNEDDHNLVVYVIAKILSKYNKLKFSNYSFFEELTPAKYYVYRDKLASIDYLKQIKKAVEKDEYFISQLKADDINFIKCLIKSYEKTLYYEGVDFNQCFNVEKIQDRERYLANNTEMLLNENPNKKFFGQFGCTHIPLTVKGKHYFRRYCDIEWNSMASMLNQSRKFTDQIISIQLIYDTKKYEKNYEDFGLKKDFLKQGFNSLKKDELMIIDHTMLGTKESKEIDIHYFILTK